MRMTRLFTKTLKDAPSDEVAKNAQLLIRAGFVHKEMAGAYAYLPLGLRVIEKVKQIVREEMNATDAEELLMTVLQPSELWQKTNRWDDEVVDNWFKTKLINGTELGVGLTHEEPIVNAARAYINSYKDLPRSVYQIGTKFRNEKRAKSGILRGREFIMKDLYSFSRDQQQHDEVYEAIAEAYHRVYRRLGIGDVTFRVKADGGIFTKRYSDEFQTISPIGEDTIFHVPGSDTYYNSEIAPSRAPVSEQPIEELEMQSLHTPGVVGVAQLAKTLDLPIERTVKTMIYMLDGQPTAVAVRGDYEVNDIKLRSVTGAESVELADEAVVRQVTGAEVGYAGLIGLPDDVRVVIDDSIQNLVNFEVGTNKTDYHNVNVNWGRDVDRPAEFCEIKQAKAGDSDPDSGQVYEIMRGVEVGNIFPLETKYTDALDVYYTDENGKQQSIIMGCYGIGVSRLMGVIAEHFADDNGLVWPENIAPYQIHLVQIGDVTDEAKVLYDKLTANGIEVLWDDRDERPGKKFADADLIGIPHRVVISPKLVESGKFEYKPRNSQALKVLTETQLFAKVSSL